MKQNRYCEATEKDRIKRCGFVGRFDCFQFLDDPNGKATRSSVGTVLRLTR